MSVLRQKQQTVHFIVEAFRAAGCDVSLKFNMQMTKATVLKRSEYKEIGTVCLKEHDPLALIGCVTNQIVNILRDQRSKK